MSQPDEPQRDPLAKPTPLHEWLLYAVCLAAVVLYLLGVI